jgi:hypothetical protein
MVALHVYMRGGGFYTQGTDSFITLAPDSRLSVQFVAFCMDFEKDNPTAEDRFSVAAMPAELLPVLANIRGYVMANPEIDVTSAAQVAIWLFQGVSIRDIRSRFAVTPEDEVLARQFIR